MKLTPGMTLQSGKYSIQRVLGWSNLSVTLQATTAQSRNVILKTLNPELRLNGKYSVVKQRFVEQVNRFSRCQHPALVQLIESFEEYDLPFAVTDYTLGHNLAKLVQTQGVLPVHVAIRYVQQVGAALDVLHRQELVHQNVTPQNIIRPEESEIVVLVNLELVQPPSMGEADRSLLPSAQEYAAIEQYQSQLPLTPVTDLYALAGTLYFLLTGRPPVVAPLRSQTALISPRQFNSQISSALETAMLQGLEMKPKARPATLTEWLSQLSMASASTNLTSHVVSEQTAEHQTAEKLPARLKLSTSSGAKSFTSQSAKVSKSLSSNPSQPMISVPSKRFSGAILMTVLIAASAGIGTGLFLRLAATTTGAGTTFFHSTQSFPRFGDWPGESLPLQVPAAAPIAPSQAEDYRRDRPTPIITEVEPVIPTPAPEVNPPLPEEAPVMPPSPPPATAIEPAVPPPAPMPEAIAPEPAAPPVAPQVVPELAPPPPGQPVDPAGAAN